MSLPIISQPTSQAGSLLTQKHTDKTLTTHSSLYRLELPKTHQASFRFSKCWKSTPLLKHFDRLARPEKEKLPVTLSRTQSTPIPVKPGNVLRLHIRNVRLDHSLQSDQLVKEECGAKSTRRTYRAVDRGTQFTIESFAADFRHQVHFRYTFMTPAQNELYQKGALDHIEWHDIWVDPSGIVPIQVPRCRLILPNTQLRIETEPAIIPYKYGTFIVGAKGKESGGDWYWHTGYEITEYYQTVLEGTVEI